MHLDLFKELAKTIRLPSKLKGYSSFDNEKIENMTALDCKTVLEQNAAPLRETDKDFTIGKNIFPKDGYSDGLRVLEYVRSHVEEQYVSSLAAPCLKGQLWEGLPFEAAYLFRQAYESHGGTPLKARSPNAKEDLDLWNGAYLGDLQDYEDDVGFTAVPIPKAKEYYHNFALKPREAKAFMDAQADQGQWTILQCDDLCERTKHVHAVSGRYFSRWTIKHEDGKTTTIHLAPPLSVAKLGKLDLKVNKNCVLGHIVKTTKAFQGVLLENGAEKTPKESQGAMPACEDPEEGNDFRGIAFPTAYDACRALANKGDYGDLQAVIRNTKNLKWRQLDKIAGTSSQLTRIKKELGNAFTTSVLPMVQQTGGADLRDILTQCTKVATKWGALRKDNILGYLISRLAEPVHNICTIDGKVIVVAPDGLGAAEENGVSGSWADF